MPQRVVAFIQRNIPACVVATIVLSAMGLAASVAWIGVQVQDISESLVQGRVLINSSVTEAKRAKAEAEAARAESIKIREQLESDVNHNRKVTEVNKANVNELYDWVKSIYEQQKKVEEKVDTKLNNDVKP
jgi:hypothetical protein